jgi:hypothetical protein
MNDLFTCTRFDGAKELTQMGKLFLELERTHNNLTSLSYDDEQDDPMCFNASIDCAIDDFKKALKNLQVHCASVERSAQMAGVM